MASITTPNPASSAALSREDAPRSDRPGILSPAGITMLVLLAGAFVALFFRWFVKQNQFSLDKLEDWGHSYIIPLVSAGLIWMRRERILATTPEVFWPGLVPIVTGIMGYFFFVVGFPNHMFQGFSMILTIFGIVLLLLGPSMMRWLFLPIAYLGFAVTISEMIMIKLTFQLQLLASDGAGMVLTLLGTFAGFAVDVDGNTIIVTGSDNKPHPLNVAEACSGMRMVIAFIALGAAVALVQCKHWWQRVALVLLSIPISLGLNVVRVVVLGIASLFDSDLATGDAHMLIGTLLLIPGFFLFLGTVWVLNKIVIDPEEKKSKTAAASVKPRLPEWFTSEIRWSTLTRPSFVVTLMVLAFSAAGFGAGIRNARIHLQKLPIQPPEDRAVSAIPTETASWIRVGTDRREKPEIEKELGTTNYLTRTYVEKNPVDPRSPARIELHLAYYTGMIDTVPHVPDRCFVGGGMVQTGAASNHRLELDSVTWSEDTSVPERDRGMIFRAPVYNEFGAIIRRVRLPRNPKNIEMNIARYSVPGGGAITAGYFFIANGGAVPRAENVRLLAFNLEDDYAYYLKVQTSSVQTKSTQELADVTARLLSELLPEIMRCVPDWVDVEAGLYPPDNPRRPQSAASAASLPEASGPK